jgi:hypothetical protein
MQDWTRLSDLTQGESFFIRQVELRQDGTRIEGAFELPPLATLEARDQLFIAAFVRAHGSIKRMEELLGLSYPSIKNRLNQLAGKLEGLYGELEIRPGSKEASETSDAKAELAESPEKDRLALLEAIRAGEKSVSDVLKELKKARQ